MLFELRREHFPHLAGEQGLEPMADWVPIPKQEASKPSEQKPQAKAAASSAVIPMPLLNEVDEVTGRRGGALIKLAELGLALQSKVNHPMLRGVYTIEEVCGPPGSETIRLKQCTGHVSMEDLWGALAAKQAKADAAAVMVCPPRLGARTKALAKPPAPADPAADAPGGDVSVEVATEKDYSFQCEHSIPIDDFVTAWKGCEKAVKEFSFDPDLSEKGHQSKDKALKNSLFALVVSALSQAAATLDDGIQSGKVTKGVNKPVAGVYAYPGHHEQKANRL